MEMTQWEWDGMRTIVPETTTNTFILTLVICRLDYCNTVLATFQPLQRVQNATSRLVTDSFSQDHCIVSTSSASPIKSRYSGEVLWT